MEFLHAVIYTPAFQVCDPTYEDNWIYQPFSALTAGPWSSVYFLLAHPDVSPPVKLFFLLEMLTQCVQVIGHGTHLASNGWNRVFLAIISTLAASLMVPLFWFLRSNNTKIGSFEEQQNPICGHTGKKFLWIIAIDFWLVCHTGRFLAVAWVLLCLSVFGMLFVRPFPEAKSAVLTAIVSLWIAEVYGVITDGIYCQQLQETVGHTIPFHALGHLLIDQVAVVSFNRMLVTLDSAKSKKSA